MAFQHNLDQLMRENFLSNYELAKALNVHATTVAAWRKGEKEPRIRHLGKLVKYFGCTVDDLLGKTEEE